MSTVAATKLPPANRTTPEDELRAELQEWARQLDEGKSSLSASDVDRIARLGNLARECGRGSKTGAYWGDLVDQITRFQRSITDSTAVALNETRERLVVGALTIDFGRKLVRAAAIRALEKLDELLERERKGVVAEDRRRADLRARANVLREHAALRELLDGWGVIAMSELRRLSIPRGAHMTVEAIPPELSGSLMEIERVIDDLSRRLALAPIVDWRTARADPSLVAGPPTSKHQNN